MNLQQQNYQLKMRLQLTERRKNKQLTSPGYTKPVPKRVAF